MCKYGSIDVIDDITSDEVMEQGIRGDDVMEQDCSPTYYYCSLTNNYLLKANWIIYSYPSKSSSISLIDSLRGAECTIMMKDKFEGN